MFEHECSILHLVKAVKKRSNQRQQGHYAWSCCALPSAPTNKSLLLNSNQQNLLAKSGLVLACLRSDKQIALAQIKSAKPTCKILSCLGLSPLPQKIAQFKSEKPTRKICLGLANQILNIAKFDTSALDLKIVCFYLDCLFDILSRCRRCSLRGIVLFF